MKLFHLSDLHIGLKLFDRDLHQDQVYVLEQIASYVEKEKPDVILIAGDIYDKATPSPEAVTLFDNFLSDLHSKHPGITVMAISGNHDNAERLNQYRSFLSKLKLYMIGVPPEAPDEYIEKVTLTDEHGKVNFYLLPFVKPSMAKKITQPDAADDEKALSYNEAIHKMIGRENIDTAERNVFVSHQFYVPKGKKAEEIERADSETPKVGNVDAVDGDFLKIFDYAALGHIHKPTKVGGEQWRYCGTPMPYSVSEADQEKGIVMAELGAKGEVSTRVLPLEPLHAVRVIRGYPEEVLKQRCEDYVSVVLTDNADPDIYDMQDRLRAAFPNLLEIRRERQDRTDGSAALDPDGDPDIMQQCAAFLGKISDEEKELLEDVINTVLEGK